MFSNNEYLEREIPPGRTLAITLFILGSSLSQDLLSSQQQQQRSPPRQQGSGLPHVALSSLKPGADGKGVSDFNLPSLSTPPQSSSGMGQFKPSGSSTPPSSSTATTVHLPAIAPQTASTSNPIPSFPSLPSNPVPSSQIPARAPLDGPRFPSGGRLPFNDVNRPTGVPHVNDMGRPAMRPPVGNLPPGNRLPPGNFPLGRPPGELPRPPAVGLLPGPDASGRLPPVSDLQFPPSLPLNRPGIIADMRPPGEIHRPLPPSSFPQQSPGMPPPAAISPAGAPRRPLLPPSLGMKAFVVWDGLLLYGSHKRFVGGNFEELYHQLPLRLEISEVEREIFKQGRSEKL